MRTFSSTVEKIKKYYTGAFVVFFVILLYSCGSIEGDGFINLVRIDDEKNVDVGNLNIKSVKKTKAGVVVFYDTIQKADYSDAMGLIPKNTKDVEAIYKSLQSKKVSFTYDLPSVSLKGDENLFLVIDNEEGEKTLKKYRGNGRVIKMKQISHYREHTFEKQKISKMKFDDLTSIGEMLSRDANKDQAGGGVNCSSGGPGAISCSVSDVYSKCSITCSSGYYACCQRIKGDNMCFCIPN